MNSGRTVAIIPTRGGSVGIPRKNARIMGGKPLLAHMIEAALKCEEITDVFVSTDDAELREVGLRYGAKILPRPENLAGSVATLDEVICHAAKELDEIGVKFEHVVTLQATSPLLKVETISQAIRKCQREGLDTVLSVCSSPHLAWTKNQDGGLVPLYKTRVNRQQLPPYYRETGGVVVATRDILRTGSRFGQRIGVIEVNKTESLDIDDYFDWWLVEKSLARKRICIRTIGNRQSGLGHVYRALTLADRLIDHDLWFLVSEDDDLAQELIRKRFYRLLVVPTGGELEAILEERPNLVVNDVLDTDSAFMAVLKNNHIITINFEDIGPGSLAADYLINAMYYDHPTRKDSRVYHGLAYDCLRDEFVSAKPITPSEEVKNILVLFGGTDPAGLTRQTLEWLDALIGQWKITVILGLGYGEERTEHICKFTSMARHEVEVVTDTTIISHYMSKADLAVTSAGRTVFELASLAVPMVVITQNEREKHHAFAHTSLGIVNLGSGSTVTITEFQTAIMQMLDSSLLRRKMHQALLNSEVRNGIERVLGVFVSALTDPRD